MFRYKGRELQSKKIFQKQGMTLVEILLAVMIFSVIAFSIGETFHAGMVISRRFETNGRLLEEGEHALEVMADDFSNAIDYDFGALSAPKKSFVAGLHSIILIKPAGQGLVVVHYFFRTEEKAHTVMTQIGKFVKDSAGIANSKQESVRQLWELVREEQPLGIYYQKGFSDPVSKVILKSLSVDGCRFYFAGWDNVSQGDIVWQSTWSQNSSPVLLGVDLTLLSSISSFSLSRVNFRPIKSPCIQQLRGS